MQLILGSLLRIKPWKEAEPRAGKCVRPKVLLKRTIWADRALAFCANTLPVLFAPMLIWVEFLFPVARRPRWKGKQAIPSRESPCRAGSSVGWEDWWRERLGRREGRLLRWVRERWIQKASPTFWASFLKALGNGQRCSVEGRLEQTARRSNTVDIWGFTSESP